jgi:hypothetical protein
MRVSIYNMASSAQYKHKNLTIYMNYCTKIEFGIRNRVFRSSLNLYYICTALVIYE